MARYRAFADSVDVIVRDASGREVESFARTGLESMQRMDAELERRGYTLDAGGWSSEMISGGILHARGMRK